MKKFTLTFEPDFDFKLLAIVSPLRAFKLCWLLDQKLEIKLQREEDLALTPKRNQEPSYFQVFGSEESEEDQESYILFGNKTSNGFLVPEQKVVDYYLKIDGGISDTDFRNLADRITALPGIQHGFSVDPDSLKSKQNFIL